MADPICTNCGSVAGTRKRAKGSLALEIVLWCLAFVPGLIYTIWRQTTKERVCRMCGSTSLVPVDTPAGQKLLAQLKAPG